MMALVLNHIPCSFVIFLMFWEHMACGDFLQVCKDGGYKYFYADPTSCKHFYSCSTSGGGHRYPCPIGTTFNQKIEVCDWPFKTECDVNTTTINTTSTIATISSTNATKPQSRLSTFTQSSTATSTTTIPASITTATPSTTTTKTTTITPVITTTTPRPTTTTTTPIPISAMISTHVPKTSRIVEEATQPCKRIVCYFSNQQLSPLGRPDNVNGTLCTHFIYRYAAITVDGKITAGKISDEMTVLDQIGDYKRILAHKQTNTNLKVILSVGGPDVKVGLFMRVILTALSRKTFIDSVISFLRIRNFDGIDLDWQYPAQDGSFEEDRDRFSLLVKELREAFDQESTPRYFSKLVLTASVSARKRVIDNAYNVSVLNQYLDFINLKSYGFHSSFEPLTAHPSPLYAGVFESGSNLRRNVGWAASYWVFLGASRDKLVIGVPLYGVEYKLLDERNSNVSDATTGNGGDNNIFYYFNICAIITSVTGNTRVELIQDQKVPYLVSARVQWIGFENQVSLKEKVKFVQKEQFGGVAVDSIRMDDMTGSTCGQGRFPLLSAIHDQCQT